jgi:large subunit ribosomal protein L4
MSTVQVSSPLGDLARSVELPDEVFGVQVNVPLIHQVVVGQLAAARAGTHDTKTRGEVRGGGRKPYRQKGTGRARQGSTRAPQFAGGGVVHGPTPRDYAQRTPKKMKAAALRGALSDRAGAGRVHVVAGLVEGDVPSTKAAARALATLTSSKHILVVTERDDVNTWKSLRNVENVHLIAPDQLNAYDVLVSDDVVFTEGSLAVFLAGPQSSPGGLIARRGGSSRSGSAGRTIRPSAEAATADPAALGDAVSALAPGPVDQGAPSAPEASGPEASGPEASGPEASGPGAPQAELGSAGPGDPVGSPGEPLAEGGETPGAPGVAPSGETS